MARLQDRCTRDNEVPSSTARGRCREGNQLSAKEPSEYRERELKFDAPADWVLPDLSDAVPPGAVIERQEVRLTTTYYDTPGRDLFESRITLRRREGDIDTGWQLKVPDGDARLEIREDDAGADLPASLDAMTLGLRGGAVLDALATLRTARAIHRVVADGKALAEIVVDDVTSEVTGEPAATQRWREVEVELVDGDEALLQQLGAWLQTQGVQPAASGSKLASALGAPRAKRDMSTMAGLIASYLDQQVEVIIRGDLDIRRGRNAIHPTRVATRRYRSVLRVFAKAFATDRAALLDGELAWYAAALGEVRDRHVLREQLDTSLNALPADLVAASAASRINEALDAELQQAEGALTEVMCSDRYYALLRSIRVFRDQLPGLADQPALAAARYVRKAERAVAHRLDKANESGDEQALHRVRKAAKRARYVAEAAEPALGEDAAKLASRAHKTQRSLGNRRDALLVTEFLLRLGAGADGFALGVLYERERARLQMEA